MWAALGEAAFAQESAYEIHGRVYDAATREPLFATVIAPEIKAKAVTDENGYFKLETPGAGVYQVYVQSSGFERATLEVRVREGGPQEELAVALALATMQGQALHVTGEREIQNLSRHTMTQEEIREVPATLGDSINALSSFSGVDQFPMFGGLGPLIIRGADPFTNRYYIDGIPVHSIQHFLGLQSVVSNDLIDKIDLYSSMAPVEYGNSPLGGVINVNTIDSVKKRSVHIDIGVMSSNVTIMAPIKASSVEASGEAVNKGYWVGAFRYGYLTAILGPMLESATGDAAGLPNYYDYQFKGKYFLNKENSVAVLLMGYGDSMDRSTVSDAESRKKALEDGTVDPFMLDFEVVFKLQNHIQSLWYTYRPSDVFTNKLKVFSSLNSLYRYQNIDSPDAPIWLRDQERTSNQNIFGVREEVEFHIRNMAVTHAGLDATLYNYKTEGNVIIPKKPFSWGDNGPIDEDLFDVEYLSQNSMRWVYSAFLDQNIKLGAFTFDGGVRGDYYPHDDLISIDPRGLVSWELPGDAILSAGAGSFGSMIHTNFYWQSEAPQLIDATGLEVEKGVHRTAGFEKLFGALYSLKVEAFYNTFDNLFVPASGIVVNGKAAHGDNLSQREVYGAEVTLRKSKTPANKVFYGWMSYTYMDGLQRSGLPSSFDPQGSEWINNEMVRKHAFKAVAGYKFNNNTLGARFRMLSSLPYTPIVGDDGDPYVMGRYAGVTGDRFSEYLPIYHQLDLRFSRNKVKEWGRISWYLEVQNLYDNHMPVQLWKYNAPYEKGVNPVVDSDQGIGILPTFGVEIYF